MNWFCACCWTVLIVLAAPVARADVKLPAVIGDYMVLQQGIELPFWGWAEPGEQVSVSLAGKMLTTAAAADGRWVIHHLAIHKFGPVEVSIIGKNTIILKNVIVGEVWVCSGQSNMNGACWSLPGSRDEIAAATLPMIRLVFTSNARPLWNRRRGL